MDSKKLQILPCKSTILLDMSSESATNDLPSSCLIVTVKSRVAEARYIPFHHKLFFFALKLFIFISKMSDQEPLTPSSGLYTCLACQVAFQSAEGQRNHYKSDWHRYNLKRKVVSLPPVTSDQFNAKTEGKLIRSRFFFKSRSR